MVRRKAEWPAEDELVLCTIKKVFAQGAFAALDEFEGKEGMIHISEVASGWIKNIRDFVKEGQKTVCKVLAVNPQKGHVDLSMRRVKDSQRRWKALQFKHEQRAEKLLELAAKKLRKSLDKAYDEVGFVLQDRFGDLYSALEAVATKGKDALAGIDIDKKWIEVISEVASSTVEVQMVEVAGHVELSCPASNGVDVIKSALINARASTKTPDVDVDAYYVGSPRYRVRISAPSYKVAENTLQKFADIAIADVKKAGGKGELIRASKGG